MVCCRAVVSIPWGRAASRGHVPTHSVTLNHLIPSYMYWQCYQGCWQCMVRSIGLLALAYAGRFFCVVSGEGGVSGDVTLHPLWCFRNFCSLSDETIEAREIPRVSQRMWQHLSVEIWRILMSVPVDVLWIPPTSMGLDHRNLGKSLFRPP